MFNINTTCLVVCPAGRIVWSPRVYSEAFTGSSCILSNLLVYDMPCLCEWGMHRPSVRAELGGQLRASALALHLRQGLTIAPPHTSGLLPCSLSPPPCSPQEH